MSAPVAAVHRRRPRPAVLAWPAVTLLVSFAMSLLVTRIVWAVVDLPGPTADLESDPVVHAFELTGIVLVALLVALVVVVVVTLVLWTAGIVWGARRLFPAGRRLVPAVTTLGVGVIGSVLAVALVGAASSAGGDLGAGWYVGAVGVAAAASCAVFPVWDARMGPDGRT